MDNSDVVIIGGGLVGLAFACALKGSGLQVTLIESQSAPRASDELSSDAAQTASHRSNRDGAQLIGGQPAGQCDQRKIPAFPVADRGLAG